MDWLIALIALTAMEIVLGIDNIVFITIVVGQLPVTQQAVARRLGLALAMLMRIGLLLTLTWILGLSEAVFYLTDLGIPESWFDADRFDEISGISWKDMILFGGGLFLIGKSVHEIHKNVEGAEETTDVTNQTGFTSAIIQIVLLDIIFSLDSVITAVGMVKDLWVMIVAVILAVGVMLVFAGAVSRFVERHPTLKMLALSFLILIGVMLVAEGIGTHIEKGYIYFAMAFAIVVEMLNIRVGAAARRSATA